MSATEIIQELPKLSPAERRTVRRVLSDLAAKEEDVQLCNQVATEAAMMFDRMEEEDHFPPAADPVNLARLARNQKAETLKG